MPLHSLLALLYSLKYRADASFPNSVRFSNETKCALLTLSAESWVLSVWSLVYIDSPKTLNASDGESRFMEVLK